jgi:hypothetical protein
VLRVMRWGLDSTDKNLDSSLRGKIMMFQGGEKQKAFSCFKQIDSLGGKHI